MNELVVVGAVLLALVLSGPVTTLRRGRCLNQPAGSEPGDLASAATAVIGAIAVGAVAAAVIGTYLSFFGAGLSYSDAQNGIPPRVQTQLWLQAWVPVLLLLGATVLARVKRQFSAVFLLGLLAPVWQLVLAFAVGFVFAAFPAQTHTPAPAPAPVSDQGCEGTPRPGDTLPPCPDPSSPDPSSPSPAAPSGSASPQQSPTS